MVDRHTKEKRSYIMSCIKSKDTEPEVYVRKYLFSKGLRYRKNVKTLPGCPDMALPKHKTAIFVNGCFWHQHENCKYSALPESNAEYWKEKLGKNKRRDAEKIRQLENDGWRVLVVWTCELKPKIRAATVEKLYQEIISYRGFDIALEGGVPGKAAEKIAEYET